MFLKGLILGFSIAAPVGPIGLICIQRTLSRGRLHGFVSGLGAATADACYGMVAALGLTAVSSALLGVQFWLQLAGGLFLVWLGFRTLLKNSAGPVSGPADKGGLLPAYFSVFALTLANPATIISFLGIFAGLGLAQQTGAAAALPLVGGVFTGSAAWWLVLSFLAGAFRHRLGSNGMRLVNVAAGLCIIALGLWALFPLVQGRG